MRETFLNMIITKYLNLKVMAIQDNCSSSLFLFFLSFDFCRFCVVIRFFHHCHNGQWPPTSKDFYTRSYPLHYFLILILEKKPVFPFPMLSAKQGHYWYHFYKVFGVTRSLTGDWTRDLPHSNPALIPLGYRGGGIVTNKCNVCLYKVVHIVWRIKGDNLKYGLQHPIQEVIVSRSVIP